MNKWDNYFKFHYKSVENHWGKKDLEVWKNWYYSWIEYINKKVNFKLAFGNKPHILEVGSAIGGVSAILQEKGWNVTGSDISKEMVKAAGKTNQEVGFIYCDIQKKIPGKYNAVFGFEVLEHIENPITAIINIKNCLKKSGYFIGSTPYPFAKAYIDPTHKSVLYPQEWKRLFHKGKFSTIKIYPMSFIPYIWRIHKKLNIVLPFYVPFPGFVSTTLIIAKK